MNSTSQSEDKRSRFLTVAASVLLLVAVSVFGGLFYLQHKAAAGQYPSERPWENPQTAAALRKVRLEQAQALRERYGKWAEKHQDGLKRLLRSKDEAAFLTWYRATDPEDPNGPLASDPNRGNMGYTWEAERGDIWDDSKVVKLDAETIKMLHDGKRRHFMSLRSNYMKNGDYKIARSLSVGPESMALWASGRITIERIAHNPVRRAGAPAFIEVEPEEVVPAFDFLRER